ncbi:MAG: nicotinamide riboside transporter PnuC [Bacteroides sp.]
MNYLEILGTAVGLVYLWLEYRAHIYLWIAGVVMPAIYIFVYYDAGLYADFGINIYYLLAAIYGWTAWKHQRKSADESSPERPITRMALQCYLPLAAVFLVTFVVIAWVLIRFTDSTVPWLDSFTTALSMVAMWMLARKYVEQWLAWIAVDGVCCGLYFYKELPFTATLYGLYAVIALLGYYKWKRMMA